jgi:hypothetical protein
MTAVEVIAATSSWGAMTATLSGTEDWDQTVFDALAAGTYDSTVAQSMWAYTDGYRIDFATTHAVDMTSI